MRRTLSLLAIFLSFAALAACVTMSKTERAYIITQTAVAEHWGNDWEALVEETTRAIELDPTALWPYSVRGAAQGMMNNYDEAFTDINYVLDISPDYEPALANRGILYMRLGMTEEAHEDLEEALLLDPDDVAALVAMSGLMSQKGDLLKSCSLMTKAVEYGYRDLAALYALPEYSALTASKCMDKMERYIEEEVPANEAGEFQ